MHLNHEVEEKVKDEEDITSLNGLNEVKFWSAISLTVSITYVIYDTLYFDNIINTLLKLLIHSYNSRVVPYKNDSDKQGTIRNRCLAQFPLKFGMVTYFTELAKSYFNHNSKK